MKTHYNKLNLKIARLISLLTITILMVLVVIPVYGEEEIPDFELDQIVVTATKIPVKLKEAGANVSVVTKEEIEKMHYQNLEEVLRHVTGVDVLDHSNGGGRSSLVSINGTEKILFLIDGRRMNLPNATPGMLAIDFNNIIALDNIERVEVVKGSASALYGADAIGGIVNIITRKGKENSTALSLGGGSFNKKDYGLIHQGQQDDLSWYLTAKEISNSDLLDAKGHVIKNSSNNSKAYSLKLNKKLSEKEELAFSYSYYKGNEHYPDSTRSIYDPNRRVEDNEQNWDLVYTNSPSNQLQNQLRLYQNRANYKDYGFYYKNYYDMRTNGFQYQLNREINKFHLLVGGIEYYQDQLSANNFSGASIVPKVAKGNTSFFLQDRWKMNGRITLDAGIRYDYHETYGSKTTPRLTLNYEQGEKNSYYISYNKFFKAPTLYELYSKDVDLGGGWMFSGNPSLKPENGQSIEIGANHRFDKTLETTVHYFVRRVNDAIVTNSDWTTFENSEKQKAHGWDIQINKRWGPAFTTFANCRYLVVENKKVNQNYKKDGNIPELIWNVGADYTRDKWNIQLLGRGIENRPGSSDSGEKLYPEKTYWVWDTALNMKLNANTKAFIKVNNIFNQYYAEYTNVSYYHIPEDWYPAPGRNFTFGVEYKL